MTTEEARSCIGRRVVYQSNAGPPETGEITSVGFLFAFVRYDGDVRSKATAPERLSLESDSTAGAR